MIQGKTGGVDWRVHVNCFYVAGEELPRIVHSWSRLYYIHCRPDVWPCHEARPTGAEKQINGQSKQLQRGNRMSASRLIDVMLMS